MTPAVYWCVFFSLNISVGPRGVDLDSCQLWGQSGSLVENLQSIRPKHTGTDRTVVIYIMHNSIKLV